MNPTSIASAAHTTLDAPRDISEWLNRATPDQLKELRQFLSGGKAAPVTEAPLRSPWTGKPIL